MKTIVLATSNEHKLKEIKDMMADYDIVSLKDIGFAGEIEEKKVHVDKEDWLETSENELESELIEKYVESKDYTKPEYEALIEKMKDEARKRGDEDNYDTYTRISYFMPFDELYLESERYDIENL